MHNSSSPFEIEVEAGSCLFVISESMLRVVSYQILSKDDKIFLASCWVRFLLRWSLLLFRQDSFMLSLSTTMNPLPKQKFFNLILVSLIWLLESLSALWMILENSIWIFSVLPNSRITYTHFLTFLIALTPLVKSFVPTWIISASGFFLATGFT